jgi:molybdate/tungstate transport system permease protein
VNDGHAHAGRGPHRALSVVAALLASLLLLFLAAPIVRLITEAGGDGILRLGSDAELRGSLALTALTATTATLIGLVCGTPLAWVLARREFPGRAALSALLDLPLLIPHPVAGIALLLLLGRESAVGGAALDIGLRIVGTPWGIIAAMLFVSAPLFVSGAREAFAKVDPRYEGVARTLGDPPWRAFRRVTLPLANRGLLPNSFRPLCHPIILPSARSAATFCVSASRSTSSYLAPSRSRRFLISGSVKPGPR